MADWFGAQGHDLLIGGDGVDVIDGGFGDDILLGGGGDDFVFGGEGDDHLAGGAGLDVLTGGAGADQFAFEPNGGLKFITDFNPAEGDRLVLDMNAPFDIMQFEWGLLVYSSTSFYALLGVELSGLQGQWLLGTTPTPWDY